MLLLHPRFSLEKYGILILSAGHVKIFVSSPKPLSVATLKFAGD